MPRVLSGVCDLCRHESAIPAGRNVESLKVKCRCGAEVVLTERSDNAIPFSMHLLFENGLFLGAFEDYDAAVRMSNGRVDAGKPQPELVTYWRKQ